MLYLRKDQLIKGDYANLLEQLRQSLPQFRRVLHLQQFSGHDHGQAAAIAEQLGRQLDERDPGVGKAVWPVPEHIEQSKRLFSLPLIEILEPDKGRIADHHIVATLFEQCRGHVEEAAAPPLQPSLGTVEGALSLLQFTANDFHGRYPPVAAEQRRGGGNEAAVATARFKHLVRRCADRPIAEVVGQGARRVVPAPNLLLRWRSLVGLEGKPSRHLLSSNSLGGVRWEMLIPLPVRRFHAPAHCLQLNGGPLGRQVRIDLPIAGIPKHQGDRFRQVVLIQLILP